MLLSVDIMLDMIPDFTQQYPRYGRLSDVELGGNRYLRECASQCADSKYIALCQDRFTASLPTRSAFWVCMCSISFSRRNTFRMCLPSLSAFSDHILAVLFLCPKEKMLQPDTSPRITRVKNKHPFRDGSECHFPYNSRCDTRLSINSYFPVSVATGCPSP
jgi:hypothetical protein